MNLQFLRRPRGEQALIFRETAARRGVLAVLVEKDFWVSWTLAILFGHPEFGAQLVFKGGTSLSKVFGVIARFSEDIDLSLSPSAVGRNEDWGPNADSRSKFTARMRELEELCIERVSTRFLPELERIARTTLGERSDGRNWMEFQVDATTHSPVVFFHYPSQERTGFDYLGRSVKLEFGSLTDQRPVGKHVVRPWVVEEFPGQFSDFRCEVVALELERTFWEKATLLHAEHHRDLARPMRDRISRHYSDLAALAQHDACDLALLNSELRQRVADWKGRFFAASWARYELAKPGTFRLVPPDSRFAELAADYRKMRPMFLTEPAPFERVIEILRILEHRINQG